MNPALSGLLNATRALDSAELTGIAAAVLILREDLPVWRTIVALLGTEYERRNGAPDISDTFLCELEEQVVRLPEAELRVLATTVTTFVVTYRAPSVTVRDFWAAVGLLLAEDGKLRQTAI